jgi:thiamine-phosphate pyrophosphorylase
LRTSADDAAQAALGAGVRLFQYRNKRGTRKTIYENCLRLAVLLKRSHAVFIVNDHPDIAMAVDADGVHLGQDDLPAEDARRLMGSGRIIGVSTHSIAQARAAESVGADYVGFGPVFPTETKDSGPLQGISALRQVRSAVTVPIFAIGGIRSGNIGDVLAAGADGVAVISAILGAPDISVASRQLVSRFKDHEVHGHTR